jgi:hypothetical protein
MSLENKKTFPENYENPEMERAEIEALVEKFKENPELYDEWKKQQPEKYTREWFDNHSSKRVRDYSRAELVIGLNMEDPEILDALGIS